MKHNAEKIIEALTVIKEVCEENEDCNTCPLRMRDEEDTDGKGYTEQNNIMYECECIHRYDALKEG